MEGKNIDSRQRLMQVGDLRAPSRSNLLRIDVRVINEYVHVEGECSRCDAGSDSSESDNQQRFPTDFSRQGSVPVAEVTAPGSGIVFVTLLGQGEYQVKGLFGNRDGIAANRNGQGYASCG